MGRIESWLFSAAWFMGATIIALGLVHVAFLNSDWRPTDGQETGWVPLVGEVPTLVMVLGWEVPTAGFILGGLIYHQRHPCVAGVLLALGIASYAIHFWYFVPIVMVSIGTVVAVLIRSRRLIRQRKNTA